MWQGETEKRCTACVYEHMCARQQHTTQLQVKPCLHALLVPQVVGAAVREEGACGSAPGHSCLLEPVQTDFLTTGALLVHWWLHLPGAPTASLTAAALLGFASHSHMLVLLVPRLLQTLMP